MSVRLVGMWASDTEAIEDLLNSSLAALYAVSDVQLGPVLNASNPAPDRLERSDVHARAVASALRTEVASLLGLTVGFSDSDGDS